MIIAWIFPIPNNTCTVKQKLAELSAEPGSDITCHHKQSVTHQQSHYQKLPQAFDHGFTPDTALLLVTLGEVA